MGTNPKRLIEGEYYHFKYSGAVGVSICKYKHAHIYPLNQWFYRGDCIEYHSRNLLLDVRKATKRERDWLDACILQRKYVEMKQRNVLNVWGLI